ncbi:inactive nicotinamidase [Carex littledalei]|uniref:Inactive nicotinamidase n=1 Tax=Carex littledalei TaxID=544730 RepID=A0A833RCR8_9POAL|nr:inactive nicotinamidase [Carex littledalei]
MTAHLALVAALLFLLLSFDKRSFFQYLKNKIFIRNSEPRRVDPAPMATTPCKWDETALLVIDMQAPLSQTLSNDFVLPAMGSPMLVAGAKAIVPSVAKVVSLARERGIFVIWVVREHDPSGRDVELFRRHHYSNGKGPTMKGAKGAELVEGLKIREGDYKLVKTRFSAFFNTHLDALLKGSGIKRLVIVELRGSLPNLKFYLYIQFYIVPSVLEGLAWLLRKLKANQ